MLLLLFWIIIRDTVYQGREGMIIGVILSLQSGSRECTESKLGYETSRPISSDSLLLTRSPIKPQVLGTKHRTFHAQTTTNKQYSLTVGDTRLFQALILKNERNSCSFSNEYNQLILQ